MNSRQWALSVVCAMMVLTVIGCYSHYPSSVYGPSGYPGFYGNPPPGAFPQGGTVISPGLPAQGSGTTLSPGASSPSDGRSTNRWLPGSSAPAFNPATDGVPAGGADKPVPDYVDPTSSGGSAAPPFGGGGDFNDTNTVGDPDRSSDASGTSDDGDSPFDGAASNEGANDDPFVAPTIPLVAVSTTSNAPPESPIVRGQKPSPYKYDRQNYRWLRGVVDYDEPSRTWNIIYDIEPDPNDEFGGSIVLLGADRFGTLKNSDVVLVEGGIDRENLDEFGKPQFRVEKLDRLVPIE